MPKFTVIAQWEDDGSDGSPQVWCDVVEAKDAKDIPNHIHADLMLVAAIEGEHEFLGPEGMGNDYGTMSCDGCNDGCSDLVGGLCSYCWTLKKEKDQRD